MSDREMCGIHVIYRRTRALHDVRLRIEELARTLDLGSTHASMRSPAHLELHLSREGLPVIRVNGAEDAEWGQLWIYEALEHVAPYGPATIEALLMGLCLATEAHVARAFRSVQLESISDAERDGPLTQLTWLQYLGPSYVERYGRLRLIAGPFHRVEPVETGGCFLFMRPIPLQPGIDDGIPPEEIERLHEMRTEAEAYLGIPRPRRDPYDHTPFTGPLRRDTMRVLQRADYQRYAASPTTHTFIEVRERESLLASLTIAEIEELALLYEHGTGDERETAFGLLYQLTVREDLRMKSPAGSDVRKAFEKIPSYASAEPMPSAIAEHEIFEERFQNTLPMRFVIDSGQGWLRLDRGVLDVRVRLTLGPLSECIQDYSDSVTLRVAIADDRGDVYEAERSVRGDCFFRRFASSDGGIYRAVPVIRDLRIRSDARERLPAVGRVRCWGVVPFGYWLKYFGVRMDFLKEPGLPLRTIENERPRRSPDRLVLRVHPTESGGIGYKPTPEVIADVPSLAGLVFTPAAILGNTLYDADADPPAFRATGLTDAPNKCVRVE